LSPVAPRLLSVDRLLLHGGRGTHSRCTDADTSKQRTVAYLSSRGRGNRCFCRHELITIVMPLSQPGSAKTAASVCLYSVYRKQERSLFTAALQQTSNVPSADRHHPAASDGGPVVSHTQHPVGDRVPPSCSHLLFDRCATAPETRPLLAISRAHPSRVQRRPTGEAVILRPVVRGPMVVVLPRSSSPGTPQPFWACHCRLC